jgi:hypothetical protein
VRAIGEFRLDGVHQFPAFLRMVDQRQRHGVQALQLAQPVAVILLAARAKALLEMLALFVLANQPGERSLVGDRAVANPVGPVVEFGHAGDKGRVAGLRSCFGGIARHLRLAVASERLTAMARALPVEIGPPVRLPNRKDVAQGDPHRAHPEIFAAQSAALSA